MQRRLLGSLVAALCALAAPSLAQDAPGVLPPEGLRVLDLVHACQSQGRHYTYAVEQQWDTRLFGQIDYVECTAYLAGIADMNAVVKGVFGASLFCLPRAGVSADQQIRALLTWAERHPKQMNENRRTAAVSAFVLAWPCR